MDEPVRPAGPETAAPWPWIARIRHWSGKDVGLLVQFIKYTVAGGVATVVDLAVFYYLAWRVFPSLTPGDPVVRLLGLEGPVISEALRSRHFVVNNGIAFVVSNLSAYLLNILWVFEAGRHRRTVEIGLFYAVSGFSIFVGTFTGWLLIRTLGMSTTLSYLSKVVASALVNFIVRKLIIFKR